MPLADQLPASTIVLGLVAGLAPVFLALMAGLRKAGQLEQKVDNLQAQITLDRQEQTKVMESLVARLEQLGDRFTDHAVQDATHFGEIKGIMLHQSRQT